MWDKIISCFGNYCRNTVTEPAIMYAQMYIQTIKLFILLFWIIIVVKKFHTFGFDFCKLKLDLGHG